jgi:hypothetical protein
MSLTALSLLHFPIFTPYKFPNCFQIFLKVASNPHDGELLRNFDASSAHGAAPPVAEEFAHVTGRVRSASESSGLRFMFSSKKKRVGSLEGEEVENNEDVEAMIRDEDKEVREREEAEGARLREEEAEKDNEGETFVEIRVLNP